MSALSANEKQQKQQSVKRQPSSECSGGGEAAGGSGAWRRREAQPGVTSGQTASAAAAEERKRVPTSVRARMATMKALEDNGEPVRLRMARTPLATKKVAWTHARSIEVLSVSDDRGAHARRILGAKRVNVHGCTEKSGTPRRGDPYLLQPVAQEGVVLLGRRRHDLRAQ